MADKDQVLKVPKEVEGVEPGSPPATPVPAGRVSPRVREPLRPPMDLKACRECLGAIAHRMSQPMTALRGGIELGLMGKRTAPEYREILEQALRHADVMVEMIVSMRDLGEAIVAVDPSGKVDLKKLMNEVLAEFEPLAQARQLRFYFDACEPADIAADPVRLREVLQSLVEWVVQNSAGNGKVIIKTKIAGNTARLLFSPPWVDQQYLEMKMLDDLNPPGTRYAYTAKGGAARWAIAQQALKSLGGRLEVVTEGDDADAICVSLPIAPSH